ncbi:MAG: DHHW family protein [Defluviitaleaceae bacterium]|nr:DHHW family protein [Defluviitaleaceae bacterium]
MQKLNVFMGLLTVAVLAVFVLIMPKDPQASEFENRAMKTMPAFSFDSFISREFFTGLESYLLDNTSFRTHLLTFSGIVERSYGVVLPGGAMMVDFAAEDLGLGLVPLDYTLLAAYEDWALPGVSLVGAPVDLARPFSVDTHFNENAVLYLRFRENIELASRYAEVLNAYATALPPDVRVFSTLAPVKVEFMGPRYAAVNSSQLDAINFVNNQLNQRIITVDAHGQLYMHQNEYIFFRLDHHWTSLGAYYAYLAFAQAAGLAPITIDNYVEYYIDGFVGSLAVGTRNRTILEHPDTLHFHRIADGTTFSKDMFWVPADLSDACYRLFLGGDRALVQFTSSNANGRTLAVVKDSFANALVPWIAPHYENIIMFDPRQFTGSVVEYLQGFENIDLLFVNYMPATTMQELIEQIYNAR